MHNFMRAATSFMRAATFALLLAAGCCAAGGLSTTLGRALQDGSTDNAADGTAQESEDGGGGGVGSPQSEEGEDGSTNICPPCECDASGSSGTPGPSSSEQEEAITLSIVALEAQNIFSIVEGAARDFEAYKGNSVKINLAKSMSMPAMYRDIINDAKSLGGLFDGYFTNPVILGTVSPLNGFLDLTPYIQNDPSIDWTDILLPFREYVAQFEDKIYMLPLDGDTHSMYVRKDVLAHFNQTVPRTWEEYNDVARAVHGKVYNGIGLSGSCISRVAGSHAQYWTHLVLSSMTQTAGPSTGSMFDTKDMKPLTGEALVETLELLEEQMAYGVPTEFDDLDLHEVHAHHINDGTCALTYSWGDTYKLHRAKGSVVGPGQLGVYPTPGSRRVLDRKTMKLVPCTKERCKHGIFYEDIGWVNRAPYLANGGWSGAVSANAEEEKQKLVAEFFLFACSKKQSLKGVIPNATTSSDLLNGQDPFRKSQMEVDKWVNQGYDAVSAKEYQITVLENTLSKNLVVDMRTPQATEIMNILDVRVHRHLVQIRDGKIADADKARARERVADVITELWKDEFKSYDERGDTEIPILQIYQRLRGVYIADEERNLLGRVRPLGLTLMALIVTFSLGGMVWIVRNWKSRVVKASQPCFLLLICVGTLVMGASIVPMSIDDGVASVQGCSVACMAVPWLVTMGFCITFAALFSKVWRLNRLFRSAATFRRVQVSARDVIMPLCVMTGLNLIFLVIWTAVDPFYFERVETGRTSSGEVSSYGRCVSDGVTSTVMLSLILTVDVVAVILANIQAYQTRNISIEYSESYWIGLCMISILQALLIGLPVLGLASANPTASFIVRAMLVFVIAVSVLGLMFVPKISRQRRGEVDRPATDSYEASAYPTRGYKSELPSQRPSLEQQEESEVVQESASESAARVAEDVCDNRVRHIDAPDIGAKPVTASASTFEASNCTDVGARVMLDDGNMSVPKE